MVTLEMPIANEVATTLPTLLVPLDGSFLARRALPYARRLALPRRAKLLLMHAVVGGRPIAADVDVEALARPLRDDGIPVATMYPSLREYSNELVAESILAVANTRAAGLIAMSTHGRRGLGRWLYGSVAEHVLRYAEVPLLLIPPACERAWPEDRPLRLLVPLDGSPNAEAILGPVADLLAVLSADVLVAQVIDAGEIASLRPVPAPGTDARAAPDVAAAYLDAAATPLRAVARSVAIETAAGQPADALAALAHERDVDLIAMAAHGQHGRDADALGHTTLRLLRQAGVPLFLACARAQPAGTGDHG